MVFELTNEKPQSVRQAELLIYATIAASAVGALANKWLSVINTGDFMFYLLSYGLMCIIPYKLSQGSNPTRYVYLVLCVIALFALLGGGLSMPKIDMVISIVLIPVEAYIIWLLFQPAASQWFTTNKVRNGN